MLSPFPDQTTRYIPQEVQPGETVEARWSKWSKAHNPTDIPLTFKVDNSKHKGTVLDMDQSWKEVFELAGKNAGGLLVVTAT